MAFGFDGGFWRRAVIADPWPLSLLLLSIGLCLLMKWVHTPDRTRHLYSALFVYGLAVSNSHALLVAALGLQCLVWLGDRALGRDFFFANTVVFIAGWASGRLGYLPWADLHAATSTSPWYVLFLMVIVPAGLCVGTAIVRRRLFTRWKTVGAAGMMFLAGASVYLYLPIASMTNPPVNWGYTRTAEGFWHTLSRGQYERIRPTDSLDRLMKQLRRYGKIAVGEFGLIYLLIAALPFCFLHQMQRRERGWMLGLLAVYLCLAFLLLAVLNLADDRQSRELARMFFSASHLVLALWAGYGLVLLGFLLTVPSVARRSDSPRE